MYEFNRRNFRENLSQEFFENQTSFPMFYFEYTRYTVIKMLTLTLTLTLTIYCYQNANPNPNPNKIYCYQNANPNPLINTLPETRPKRKISKLNI